MARDSSLFLFSLKCLSSLPLNSVEHKDLRTMNPLPTAQETNVTSRTRIAAVTHPVKRKHCRFVCFSSYSEVLGFSCNPFGNPNSKCGRWGAARPEPCSRWAHGGKEVAVGDLERPYLDLRRRRGTCYSVWVFWFSVSVFRLLLFFLACVSGLNT